MALNYQVLLIGNNAISLRSAYVIDSEGLVSLSLAPADPTSKRPQRETLSREDYRRLSEDSAWLFRHPRSETGELELKKSFDVVSRNVKAMSFPRPPELRLLWADSGHSVALFINEEPWAFIDEKTHRGYSKGITDEAVGKQWNQAMFDEIFK